MEETKQIDSEDLSVVLATDCGSTTTKAILFEKTDKGWRSTARGEAPTTVEKPLADVTVGAVNSFAEVQELSGREILASTDSETCPLIQKAPGDGERGVDVYISTSSAGGGLQMIVAGVVASMSAQSAERAALGAGAIVMDTISIDDGREAHERISRIRHLRPDISLIAGGTEGGTIQHPLELAETILQADPRPRFGDTLRLPVIYAANSSAAAGAEEVLGSRFEFVVVDNLRPELESENLAPARDAIHELFLNHVMSHAPGYKKLLSWSPIPIMPTPAAVGNMVLDAAKRFDLQILAVDIGGATTDVFSVFRQQNIAEEREYVFNRTVSANLGMSYSIANVLLEAGVENILRWLPLDLERDEIVDRLQNKMIRPSTIPHSLEDLLLEQSICREALRLAFEHHKRLATGLKGAKKKRSLASAFKQDSSEELVDMMGLDLIIGSGGVLSHAPERESAALMMLDAYQPRGVTRLAVDSIFMMPHLGVLSGIHPAAAAEIFVEDCLVPLGTAVAPVGEMKPGAEVLQIQIAGERRVFQAGELKRIDLPRGAVERAVLTPLSKRLDLGAGLGKEVEVELHGGEVGVMVDCRGREIEFASSPEQRRKNSVQAHRSFGLELP